MNLACLVCFDEILSNSIKSIWSKFENQSIGKTPGQFNEDPHISIFVANEDKEEEVINVIVKAKIRKVKVKLIPYGIFNGSTKVVYLNVVISDSIQQLKNSIFNSIDSLNLKIDKHYENNESLLHCTIAINILNADIPKAVEIMNTLESEYNGYIDKVQIINYFPVNKVFQKELN